MSRIQKVCKLCGKSFETQECWIKKGRGIFCSLKCSTQGRDFVPPMLGKHHTENANLKNRLAHLGKPSQNKGIPASEEQRRKQSEAMKGKLQSEEAKQKNRDSHIGEKNHFFGKKHLEETKQQVSAKRQGVSLDQWEGYVTEVNHYVRTNKRYKKACMDAMKDAGFKDIFTGVKGTRKIPIECHHKIPHNMIMRLNNIQTKEQADACDLLFDKHNLIVMLKSAHDKFHNLYGDDKNIYELTEEQISELYTT